MKDFLIRLWYWFLSVIANTSRSEIPANAPVWLQIAGKELGQMEIPGEGHNPRILEYHQSTSLKATEDEVPWCAAFMCWVLEKAGIPSTRSAMARSYLKWGAPLDEPEIGCIVVFWRGSRESYSGHVAFYLGETDDYIKVLGGNQSDQVCISFYGKDRLLGYRWPILK